MVAGIVWMPAFASMAIALGVVVLRVASNRLLSFPRRRESRSNLPLDSRLRGNDKGGRCEGGIVSVMMLFVWLLCAPAMAAPSHGINLFGELKYPANFMHFDYVNPDAPKGGVLKLSHPAPFDNLNPFILKGVSAPGMNYLFESLMVSSSDEPQSYYGLIAQSVDVADDRTTADFVLRKAARWQDGTPITADDVVFSLDALKTKGHPSYRIMYQPIEKAEKLSSHKVRFYFADPTNRELPMLAASMSVLPKHYYKTVPFDKTTLTPPLGSGPYRVASVDAGRSIVYERVADYWGKDLPVNRGLYNFDQIQYDIYRDETVGLEAIKSGQYDVREEYIARNWATAYDIPAVQSGDLIKVKIPHKIPRGMQAFLFNIRQPQLADRRVREAISLTMDFEWMNETLFYGAYERSSSFFQNTDFMATGLPSQGELALLEPYRDALPPELFTQPFEVPKTDGSGAAREQLIKAQALLNDAGWEMQADGVRVHRDTGQRLTLQFLIRQRTLEKIVTHMVRNLKRIGVEASMRFVDAAQYQKRLDDRDFDITSVWWNMGVIFPGNEQISYWHSSQADVVGGNNISGLKSPLVDDLLAKLTQADSLETLTVAAKALDRTLLWQQVVIPHWHLGAWRLIYWDKFGRPANTPPYSLALESWWSK